MSNVRENMFRCYLCKKYFNTVTKISLWRKTSLRSNLLDASSSNIPLCKHVYKEYPNSRGHDSQDEEGNNFPWKGNSYCLLKNQRMFRAGKSSGRKTRVEVFEEVFQETNILKEV